MSWMDAGPGPLLLASVKASARSGEEGLCLSTWRGVTLRPVGTTPGAVSESHLRVLTDWRNRHVTAFLTEFEATTERTAAWLESTVGPDRGRILFTAHEPGGSVFGFCGIAFADWLTGSFELDSITRGTPGAPGGMSVAVRMLLDWSVAQLGLSTPVVRVMSDNARALTFYARLGFIETHRVPLRRSAVPGLVSWVPDTDAPSGLRQLVHLTKPTHGSARGGRP